MLNGKECPLHINNVLGALMKDWRRTNPEALKAIHKVNEENHGFLLMPVEIKLKFIRDMRAANFKDSTGKAIDLLSIEKEAFLQNAALAEKKPVLKKPIKLKAYQTSFVDPQDPHARVGAYVKPKNLGEVP